MRTGKSKYVVTGGLTREFQAFVLLQDESLFFYRKTI